MDRIAELKERVLNTIVECIRYPIHENAPKMQEKLNLLVDEAVELGRYLETFENEDNN